MLGYVNTTATAPERDDAYVRFDDNNLPVGRRGAVAGAADRDGRR